MDAVRTLSVAQTRATLAHIRSRWKSHAPNAPFRPSEPLTIDGEAISTEEFAFRFVYNNHLKRHEKALRRGRE